MKGKFTHILGCIILPLISITASSQSIALKSPQTPVIIDGNKNEWGDNLLYNAEKKSIMPSPMINKIFTWL